VLTKTGRKSNLQRNYDTHRNIGIQSLHSCISFKSRQFLNWMFYSFQLNILFKTNKCHHGGPPWSGGPGAIAPVAPPLNRPWVLSSQLTKPYDLEPIIFVFVSSPHTELGHDLLFAKVQQELLFRCDSNCLWLRRSKTCIYDIAAFAVRPSCQIVF